jgi:hypothetical protein
MIFLPPLGAPKRHVITHHCIEITNNKSRTACSRSDGYRSRRARAGHGIASGRFAARLVEVIARQRRDDDREVKRDRAVRRDHKRAAPSKHLRTNGRIVGRYASGRARYVAESGRERIRNRV